MVTLSEVAEQAGVSLGTASKVLNGRQGTQRFGSDCETRIRQAAAELGYRPNYLARGLASQRSEAVGLLLGPGPVSDADFWGPVVHGLGQALAEVGRHLVTIAGPDATSQVEQAAAFLADARIDGLVVLSGDENFAPPPPLLASAAPLVLVGSQSTVWPSVAVDDASGVQSAVAYLAKLGHQRLAWIGPDDDEDSSVERRLRACRRAAKQARLKLVERRFSWQQAVERRKQGEGPEAQIQAAHKACRSWPGFGRSHTAAICYDDNVAFACYAAAAEAGLRIPHDLSVIGFDDIHAACVWPGLTTISHELSALGRRAGEMIVAAIDAPSEHMNHIGGEGIEPRLIIRGSCAAPAEGT